MKEHHLSVMTLEEYEPNREFVGRNFNNGEIIQLVLRARPSSGAQPSPHWLPFHYVQMVMMHELAHCVQMNHSRAFWAVRNLYADQLRTLWARGYTGEGLWGRGAWLASGALERDVVGVAGEALPEHLCGGTFRSRRARKRGRKGGGRGSGKGGTSAGDELSYQEKKQRRIERKFGKNGVALGADEEVKVALEKGKRIQAAPRVAGSLRGRELRAAAALARFEQQPVKQTAQDGNEDGASDDDGSDYEDGDVLEGGAEADDAVDLDGQTLVDSKGNHMVKVCEDENPGDEDAANELKELQASITAYFGPAKSSKSEESGGQKNVLPSVEVPSSNATGSRPNSPSRTAALPYDLDGETSKPASTSQSDTTQRQAGTSCGICSYENEAYTVTCQMCSNVLHPASVPGAWSCQSASCQGSGYLNAGDCGTCGVCGQRRQGNV